MAEDSAPVTVVEAWRRSVQMGLEAQGPVNDIDPSLGPRWTDALDSGSGSARLASVHRGIQQRE